MSPLWTTVEIDKNIDYFNRTIIEATYTTGAHNKASSNEVYLEKTDGTGQEDLEDKQVLNALTTQIRCLVQQ